MKNQTKIITTLVVVAIVIVAIIAVIMLKDKKGNSTKLGEINSSEDLEKLVEKIYEGKEEALPSVVTNTIDVTNNDMVKSSTGLENGNDLEYLVVSEPMISSQAYSLVLAKVKNGTNANEVAKTMSEKVDQRKWICVTAEKLYATNSGNVVCLVMSAEEWAKPVYETFKDLAGSVGKEYEKTAEEGELPDELFDTDMMQ